MNDYVHCVIHVLLGTNFIKLMKGKALFKCSCFQVLERSIYQARGCYIRPNINKFANLLQSTLDT